MPFSGGSCAGAGAADEELFGGPLDASLSTTITLPGGVDGTASAVYALCLADASSIAPDSVLLPSSTMASASTGQQHLPLNVALV